MATTLDTRDYLTDLSLKIGLYRSSDRFMEIFERVANTDLVLYSGFAADQSSVSLKFETSDHGLIACVNFIRDIWEHVAAVSVSQDLASRLTFMAVPGTFRVVRAEFLSKPLYHQSEIDDCTVLGESVSFYQAMQLLREEGVTSLAKGIAILNEEGWVVACKHLGNYDPQGLVSSDVFTDMPVELSATWYHEAALALTDEWDYADVTNALGVFFFRFPSLSMLSTWLDQEVLGERLPGVLHIPEQASVKPVQPEMPLPPYSLIFKSDDRKNILSLLATDNYLISVVHTSSQLWDIVTGDLTMVKNLVFRFSPDVYSCVDDSGNLMTF